MIRLPRILTVIAGVACAAVCLAQEGSEITPIPPQVIVVRGAPFSAHIKTESTQVLADSNRIIRQTTSVIVRDGEGRTRKELISPAGAEASVVFIQDPVAGFSYVVEPQSHSVRRIIFAKGEAGESGAETNGAASPTGGLQAMGGTGVKSEALGTRIIGGLVTLGTRLTLTLPADLAGNERPLEIVSETWYSPEFEMIVMGSRRDPRFGETVYGVTDVQLRKPDPLLFLIPDGYEMREETQTSYRLFYKSIEK